MEISLFDRLADPLTNIVLVALLCVVAANLGSFLNVCLHRVPRGESPVRGGSRCPACGAPIRWRDNVPVLGWILLRGRCRDCDAAISGRYPVVEAAAALIGAIVAVELLTGGATLPPGRLQVGRIGADVVLMRPSWSLILACATHGLLLFATLTLALAEADRVRIGWRSFLVAAMAFGAMSVGNGGPQAEPGWPAASTVAQGVVAGLISGLFVRSPWVRQSLVLAGLVLGWRAVVSETVIMTSVAAIRCIIGHGTPCRRGFKPDGLDVFTALVVQVVAWRWLDAAWSAVPAATQWFFEGVGCVPTL